MFLCPQIFAFSVPSLLSLITKLLVDEHDQSSSLSLLMKYPPLEISIQTFLKEVEEFKVQYYDLSMNETKVSLVIADPLLEWKAKLKRRTNSPWASIERS